jgi:hypothetical protein
MKIRQKKLNSCSSNFEPNLPPKPPIKRPIMSSAAVAKPTKATTKPVTDANRILQKIT